MKELQIYEDTDWIVIPSVGQYRRKNGYVTLRFGASVTGSSSAVLATLPVGFRPSLPMYQALVENNQSNRSGYLAVSGAGDIQAIVSTTATYLGTLTYPVN